MKSSTSIIAYIGNGVVKGGLIYHEKGKKPIVLSERRKDLKYYLDRDRAQIETLILAEFDNLLKEIKSQDFPKLHNHKCGKPDNALIVISSPWYLSQTNTIKMQEATPFTVTEDLIDKATSNIIKQYKGTEDISVIEQNFLSVILNGYTVENPIGKKVKDLDINVFTSYSKAGSIKKIEDLVTDNFHIHNIHIHSQSLVSFSAINDLYPEMKDYAVIDVTSAITEILIVKENILKDSGSFPLGKYFLMQSVAKTMNSESPDVAESLIESYLNNRLDEGMKQKVEESLKLAEKEWLNNFSNVLKQITSNGALPNNFYLFAPHEISSIFKQFIESNEYQQFVMTAGKFEVKIINPADAYSLCEIDKEAGEVDVSMVMGALFNNKKLLGVR